MAFLYLAGRLSKSDLLDWSGKASKNKWWESLSEDVSLDIMEGKSLEQCVLAWFTCAFYDYVDW